ncbi:hypothetical protein JL49_20505 [Pseudoalteromonas luteoviolacea]|nr:hypothetical protein JL49_20505 [Pseudoalteromonas luteoviolacea]
MVRLACLTSYFKQKSPLLFILEASFLPCQLHQLLKNCSIANFVNLSILQKSPKEGMLMLLGNICIIVVSFVAMLLSVETYEYAVFINFFSSIACACYAYIGAQHIAFFLAWCNVQAFVFSPIINVSEQPSVKLLVLFLLCLMFIALGIGARRN